MNEKVNNSLYFGGYIVAFVDLLGQSSKLSELKRIKWWEFGQDTIRNLKETYGRVLSFREIFIKYITNFSKQSAIDFALQEISDPKQIQIWNQFGQSRILIKNISDSIVMTFPLLITNGLIPLKSVYGILTAYASSILTSLNSQFAFRGAVELGPCVFNPNLEEVYGSALNDTVSLEKDADWPRIIIGKTLVQYLKGCTALPNNSPASIDNCASAQRCLNIISEDEKGIFYIDYLSKNFNELQNMDNKDKIISGALEFINDQIQNYGESHKIGKKYLKLKEYFESRV